MLCIGFFSEKKNRVNTIANEKTSDINEKEIENIKGPPAVPPKQTVVENNTEDDTPSWRRPNGRQKNDSTNPTVKSTVSFSKFFFFLNLPKVNRTDKRKTLMTVTLNL